MAVAIVLLIAGLITLGYVFLLVREWQKTRSEAVNTQLNQKPIVPVNLINNDDAVLVAEGRGRVSYVNDRARQWFGMNGNEPNLSLMAQKVQPSDTFRDIFASEGRVSFRVGQRYVEATSHAIPTETGQRMVVVMRELESRKRQREEFDPVQAMSVVGEISAMLTQSFDLNATLEAILHSIAEVVPYDASEINVWQPEQNLLRPIARLGDPNYSAALEQEGGVYHLDEGYTGWIARYRQPLVIGDVATRQEINPKVEGYPFNSFIGVPLMAGERFIGTLELASRHRHTFDYEDMTLLQTLAGQVAVALENSRLYREQSNRVAELSGLQKIAQAMSALTDPHDMFRQLNGSLAELMNVEMCGVMLLSDDQQWLVGQTPLAGVLDAIVPLFKLNVEKGTAGQRLLYTSDWWYSNTTLSDERVQELGLSTLVEFGRVHSLAVVPMVVGNSRIGAVMVANPRDGSGFTEDDMRLLAVFAAQVAIVVENARLYNEEQRRAEELEGLQQIAQAIGVLRSASELYQQIGERIAGLMDVSVCGVLLFDSEDSALVPQRPFYGIPDTLLENYRIPVGDLSLMRDIWEKQDSWYSNDMLTNSVVVRSELGQLASDIDLQKGALGILQVGGQRIGMVLIGNKVDRTDFDAEDARLLSIFAGQAAVLIDNARLYTETSRRAAESENLRKIAEQVSSVVSLEVVAKTLLEETANLLNAEIAGIALLDTKIGRLVYSPRYLFGHAAGFTSPFEMDIFSPGFSTSPALSRNVFNSGKLPLTEDARVLPVYLELGQQIGSKAVLIVPLLIQNQSFGELLVANKRDGHFDDNDRVMLQAIAAQVSALVERHRLYESTDADLRNRVQELNSMERIWQELSVSLDLDRILEVTRSEILQGVDADGVSVLLIAPRGQWLDEHLPLVEKRLGLSRLGSGLAPIEMKAFNEGRAVSVDDYKGSDLNPEPQEARSAVVQPMAVDGETFGLIHAYSEKPNIFQDSKYREFIARVTRQTTLALTNARRYSEQVRLNAVLQSRNAQISKVYVLGQLVRQGATLETVLTQLAQTLAETSGFNTVLINVLDEDTKTYRATAQYGIPAGQREKALQIVHPMSFAGEILQERWKVGSLAYFIPEEAQNGQFDATNSLTVIAQAQMQGQRAWQPNDALLLPFQGGDGAILGWVSVDAPANGRRPSLETIETLEAFTREATFMIENYRTFQRIREEAEGTRAERDRLALLHLVASDIQAGADMPSRLQAVVNGIRAAGWDKVRLTMRDERLDHSLIVHAGYTEEEAARLPSVILPGVAWRERLADARFQQLRLGAAYYLRYDDPWVREHVLRGRPPQPESVPENQWHPQDILYMPLYGQDKSRIIGIIAMEDPLDNHRPTVNSLQPIELFANQASAAIENTRLYLETVRQAETEQRLTDMMEALAASLDLESIIYTLADGLQQMIAFTRMHVALPEPDGRSFNMRRVEIIAGDRRVHIFNDKPIQMDKSAMGRAFRDNSPLLYNLRSQNEALNLADLERWYSQGERITLMVPMVTGGITLGVLRLGSELENAFGFVENIELVQRMANLAAVSIDHSRLVNDLMASTAYNEAVVESIQQGIIVLDASQNITRINAYMKQRYGWTDEGVGQSLFAYQPDFEVFLSHSIETALAEGSPQYQFEIQDIDSDGNKVIRNFYTYPLRQGDWVRGVVLLVEDVTERSLLEADLAQRAEQMRMLTRVSSRITSTLSSDDIIATVLEALENVMPFDGVSLWLREGNRLRIVAARGYNDPGVASINELVGLFVDIDRSTLFREMSGNRQVINVGDTSANDPRFPYGDQRVFKNWLGAPLISQLEIIGVIAMEKREAYYYTTHHEQLLQAFANQAAIAFSNAQLFEKVIERAQELDEQTRRLELLNRVSVALAQSLDIENIFEITLRETAQALEIQEASAIKIDQENDVARIIVSYPRGNQEDNRIFNLATNKAISRIRETLLPLVIDNVATDSVAQDLKPMMRADNVTSTLLVPLVVGGTVVGAMRFDALNPSYDFTPEYLEIAQTLSSQAAVAVQNASLFEQSVIRTHELETLFEAAQATAVTLDLDEAMRRVVNQMLAALRADACTIFLWDDVEREVEVRESVNGWGDDGINEIPGTLYTLNDYPTRERVLRQREVAILRPEQETIDPAELVTMRQRGTKDRLLVPLVVNDISIGMVELEIREQPRYFETADIRLARTLASQAAVAIENARLQTDTRSHIEELYIINDLSAAVSSTVEIDQLFPMVRDQLPVLTDADILYVALFDPETQEITFPVAVDEKGDLTMATRLLGDDEFSYVIKRKNPLLLAGSNIDEARKGFGISTVLPDARCFLGVPMASGEEVVGVLAVQDNEKPRAFTFNDRRILTTVASQLGVAIQNARLFARTQQFTQELEKRVNERTSELEQERRRVETLYEITSEVAASLDFNRVLSRGLEKVARAVGASNAVILGVDEVSDRLFVMHAFGGQPVQNESERTKLRQTEGLAGWVMQNRSGVVIRDVQTDPRWVVTGERDLHQRSAVASLLEVGDEIIGVMMLFSENANAFNEDHLKLVSAAASQLGNSVKNAELYSLLRDQAERLGAILRAEQIEATKNQAILNSVADGVMYANEAGTVSLFNSTAERILGLPEERVLGRPLTELTGLYGGSSGTWLEAVERWMNDPAAHRGGDFIEILLDLEDSRTVSVRLSPVNMGDQFLGTVSVFRDITKLVEVDRLKTEFVATVSHELRTPMTSIKGYADLLLLGAAGEISEAQQRFLETIKQNADRLSILVNDLLEVSRIDQNSVPLRFTPVDVKEMMHRINMHLRGRIEDQKRAMSVEIDVEPNIPAIWADYDRIIQIVQNLADNAFNYTPVGGNIKLSAHYVADTRMIRISVADNGIGIPEIIRTRIFERFFRGDEHADLVLDTPGTGLGLSIVKSLVEMHNGTIWFDSEVGVGTTFYVEVPAVQEQAEG